MSRRRSHPFVVVNCASIPEALVESVLFGHRRGAFTGAVESAKGKFEIAGEGTVFLDEIGDMPLSQQAALLRVLEYRSFTPVGEVAERACKARFLLATNRDLRECVREGTFREDLYYRINVAAITLPALKSRNEDIPMLVDHFRARLCAEMGRAPVSVAPEVVDLFERYDWPGNVRELKNVLEGAIMLIGSRQSEITLRDLSVELLASRIVTGDTNTTESEMREKEDLIRALRQSDGNQTQAARILGVHRNTIRSKIRYFGISDVPVDQ
jgi:two-component system, NtrC family, response regulator AtoC